MLELPFDLWFQIAEQVTFRRDLLNLSLTSHGIRSATIPFLFKTATFSGSGGAFTRTHTQCMAQVSRTREQIAFCAKNKTVLGGMRHLRVTYFSGFYDYIWMSLTIDSGRPVDVPDYMATRDADHDITLRGEDLPFALRRDLHAQLVIMYQELAELIRMAPNLQRVSVFEEDPQLFDPKSPAALGSESREGRSRFPWRHDANLNYNYVEFDVQGHLPAKDGMVLPAPRLLLPPIGERTDVASQHEDSLIHFLDDIDLPIRSVSLHATILDRLSPAIVEKLQHTSRVAIHGLREHVTPRQLGNLQNILDNTKGQFEGLELSFPFMLEDANCSWIRDINLCHLTSISSPTQLLLDIVPLARNLKSVDLTDNPMEYAASAIETLKSNPLPKLSHLSLPWVFKTEEVQKVVALWPSVKELFIPFSQRVVHAISANPFPNLFSIFSRSSNVEILHLLPGYDNNNGLNTFTAVALNKTLRPQNSALRVITFDSSVAYWNPLESVWEFDIRGPMKPIVRFSAVELAVATEIVKGFYTSWKVNYSPEKSTKTVQSSNKGFIGKEQDLRWEPIYGDTLALTAARHN
ncbi:hypothetical protein M422DRAFT_257599 [Sphaerobolus stellatus SS14]|uniref:Uncharacterized protein n=1 Tax=Sphaerobolus stellatus (strain SS14) TaxID=990650 RepID=A0A0C9VDS5_SPHS4|nr:hypothetical protein M422DRAFT_257599 [Sphaerobolus stellatus SS14]